MIKNEKQYKMSRVKLDKWLLTQRQLHEGASADQPDWIAAEQAFGIEQQIKQLQAEISEYELTESGQQALPDLALVLDIPAVLIRWRIACHLTQKELATKLGLHENQIQKYERENYGCASLDTISRVATILKQVALEQRAALSSHAQVTSPALAQKVRTRWFGHSQVMGFGGSQEILLDAEEKFYAELRE
mgnify:CR=1 FL=1